MTARPSRGRQREGRVELEGHDASGDDGVGRRRRDPGRQRGHHGHPETGRGRRRGGIRLRLEVDRRSTGDRSIAGEAGERADVRGGHRDGRELRRLEDAEEVLGATGDHEDDARRGRDRDPGHDAAASRVARPGASRQPLRPGRARRFRLRRAPAGLGKRPRRRPVRTTRASPAPRRHQRSCAEPARCSERTSPRGFGSWRPRPPVRRVNGAACRQTDASSTSLRRRASARRSLVPTVFTPMPRADAISA